LNGGIAVALCLNAPSINAAESMESDAKTRRRKATEESDEHQIKRSKHIEADNAEQNEEVLEDFA